MWRKIYYHSRDIEFFIGGYFLARPVYSSLHGLAPQSLTDDLHRAGDIPSRQRLRSASSLQPEVQYRQTTLTVGGRTLVLVQPEAFSV